MSVRKVTVATLAGLKARNEKAVFVTAYDYPTATFADRAGVDMILVGDSAAMTMLGLPSTLQIGLDEMLVFIRAVTRAAHHAFVIGDLPFLSYQPSDETAIRSAGAFVAAGCDAVKCEGGARVAQRVRAMVDAGIAVMGHLGLTPQNLGQLGGYRVQGKSLAAAEQLLRDAESLERAGVFAILLEAVPAVTTSVAPPLALRPRPQVCRACGAVHEPAPIAICEQCLGPLDPVLDPARVLPTRDAIAARPWSLWRYREWLPFDGEPVLSLDSGGTPLVEAPRIAARLGVARAWVKNDAVSHPSLSFKDRVVATAINAAAAFGLDTIGCASTGNLANAVAAQAARAGLKAWIFIPEDLELAKIVGTAVYGARLMRVRGHYDDVNQIGR